VFDDFSKEDKIQSNIAIHLFYPAAFLLLTVGYVLPLKQLLCIEMAKLNKSSLTLLTPN